MLIGRWTILSLLLLLASSSQASATPLWISSSGPCEIPLLTWLRLSLCLKSYPAPCLLCLSASPSFTRGTLLNSLKHVSLLANVYLFHPKHTCLLDPKLAEDAREWICYSIFITFLAPGTRKALTRDLLNERRNCRGYTLTPRSNGNRPAWKPFSG